MRVHPTGKAGGSVAFIEPDPWVTNYEPARLEFLVSETAMRPPAKLELLSQTRQCASYLPKRSSDGSTSIRSSREKQDLRARKSTQSTFGRSQVC